MNITIAGAGQVGSHLARYLSTENQNIYVIDSDSNRLQALDSDFNLLTIEGVPTEFAPLRKGKADKADMFIAVTPVTSDNLVACSMAKTMGAKLTVARVDCADYADEANLPMLSRMGIDKVIFPELLASEAILESLRHPWALSSFDFPDGALIMLAVSIEDGAPLSDHPLKDFDGISTIVHVSAVRRRNMTIIPYGDTIIESGDILYLTCLHSDLDSVRELTGKQQWKIGRVLVSGGHKLTRTLVSAGAGEFDFTVLEPDTELCRRLTLTCPSAKIINGTPDNPEALQEAGLFNADAFIALSESDSGNILDCLTAGEAGVERRIAEIESDALIARAEALGIDSIINKKHIASGAIFQLMLDSDASNSKCLALTDAEVGRMRVTEGSKLTDRPVKDLRLPHELTLAAIIRDGHGALVHGSTRIRPGDDIIVFCLKGALHKVEKILMK